MATVEIFHTSPVKIEKITKNGGLFGSVLFFSESIYYMNANVDSCSVYKIEIDSSDIVDVRTFDLNEELEEVCSSEIATVKSPLVS